MTNEEGITADQFKSLLGDPPLTRGESVEEYWNWWIAFIDENKPKRLSDWFEVSDLAQKRWEERRLRRCSSARVDGALERALVQLLRPNYHGVPEMVAIDYYGTDEAARLRAREILKRNGITDDQIRAEAIQKCGNELLVFDRMENYRASATRQLRKEIDRRLDRSIPPNPKFNQ